MRLLVALLLLAGVVHADPRQVTTTTTIEILDWKHKPTELLDAVAATLVAHPNILRVEVRTAGANAQVQAERIVAMLVIRGVARKRLVAHGVALERPRDPSFVILSRATP